jgi:hypothetical protein
MRKLIALLIFSLIFTLSPQTSFANELAIWDTLQGTAPKGYVLLLRHSLAPGVGDPSNFDLRDCSTQRNLSALGRQDAKDVGTWLERRQIKIARVESSRWCRAKETATLLNLGKVRLNRNLDSLFQEADALNHPQTIKVQGRSNRRYRAVTVAAPDFDFSSRRLSITTLPPAEAPSLGISRRIAVTPSRSLPRSTVVTVAAGTGDVNRTKPSAPTV